VSTLPTVWTNVVAGVVLGGGPLDGPVVVTLICATSLLFVGGAYLNDAFDREDDARWRPERPIPAGLIEARRVFVIGGGMLGAGALLIGAVGLRWAPPVNWLPLGAAIALAGIITYYDAVHRRDPLSPLLMAACRVLIYAIGGLTVAGALTPPVVHGSLVLFVYAAAVEYLGGRSRNLWPLALLTVPLVGVFPRVVWGEVAAIYTGFAVWVIAVSVGALTRGAGARAAPRLAAGYALLDAVLIARAGEADTAGLVMIGFVLIIALQHWTGVSTLGDARSSRSSPGSAVPPA
jgi:4-hydroxybenzoate polyprenyltransferase